MGGGEGAYSRLDAYFKFWPIEGALIRGEGAKTRIYGNQVEQLSNYKGNNKISMNRPF